MQPDSQIAVVTGSSSGIGRATALELARAGYGIVLHAHQNLAGLHDTAHQIAAINAGVRPQTNPNHKSSALCITADISCARACRDFVDCAFAWRGPIAVWVNNAGADVLTGSARELPFESRLQRLIDTDLLGTIRLSRLAAARMVQELRTSNGPPLPLPTLINMSWDQAALGMEGEAGQLFCTTKSAVAAFSTALAMSTPGLRVNCIAPGWIKTQWGQSTANGPWSHRATAESLLNRWGSPEDVAHTIRWLASPESQFINGQTIAINGGRRFFAS